MFYEMELLLSKHCPNQPSSAFLPQNGASLSNKGWGSLVPSSSFGHWWQLSRQGVEQVSASGDWRVKMLVTVSLTLYSFLMPYLPLCPVTVSQSLLSFMTLTGLSTDSLPWQYSRGCRRSAFEWGYCHDYAWIGECRTCQFAWLSYFPFLPPQSVFSIHFLEAWVVVVGCHQPLAVFRNTAAPVRTSHGQYLTMSPNQSSS